MPSHISIDTSGLVFPDIDTKRVAHAGAENVMEAAKRRAPYAPKDASDHEAHLRDTARVDDTRGGDDTVGVVFDSPYAAYIHENLGFAHPHGGGAKFLERALVEVKRSTLRAMARAVLR